jgi:hypothetical protein
MKKPLVFQFSFVLVLIFTLPLRCLAGNPEGSYYHWSGSRLFWVMMISDSHVGTSGTQDTEFLSWAVAEAREAIGPLFIVNAGDLTDSTKGGVIPNGPYQEEWDSYRQILDAAGIDASSYYDIPGNHEAYNDADLAYYLANSIQGSATGSTQHSWVRDFPFGSYHFLGVCTAGNDGAPFSIWPWDNYGDHAGLDESELIFIESELEKYPDVELTVIFGHHPFEPGYSSWTDTGLTYGLAPLLDFIDMYGVSVYGFGHTHDYRENVYYQDLSRGVFYMNLASLGKSDQDHYAVMAIDGNGLSIAPFQKGLWPAVLISAPMDRCLGDCPSPFGYDIPQGHACPIRALVFDKNPVENVQFRVDGSANWQAMGQMNQGPLWVGFWDTTTDATGSHTIEVRAEGSSIASDSIETHINPALCMMDSNRDGDVDGADLADFVGDFVPQLLHDFAASFGRVNCP